MNKRGRWEKDCVYNVFWSIQIHYDVFWSHKFASNIPGNDEWHIKCKDLDWDVLELLLVWVDKENSMEFSFDYGILLIYLLCLLLFINSYTSLLVIPSRTSTNFLIKRKEKEKENK